jgi:hypothetical protein
MAPFVASDSPGAIDQPIDQKEKFRVRRLGAKHAAWSSSVIHRLHVGGEPATLAVGLGDQAPRETAPADAQVVVRDHNDGSPRGGECEGRASRGFVAAE